MQKCYRQNSKISIKVFYLLIWMPNWNITVDNLLFFISFLWAVAKKNLLNILFLFQIFLFWGRVDELAKLELKGGK